MRILVTGAGGFVGGHLITNLHRAGHEVIAASHRPWEPPVPVEIDVFDVRDGDVFRGVMDARQPEAVIHLAAQASVRRSWEASDETFAVNVTGTSHLLESLIGLHACETQGRPAFEREQVTGVVQERCEDLLSGGLAQELVGALYRRHFGLPVIVARPFNHTGPGQSTEYAIGAFSAQVAEIERGDREPVLRVGWLESRRDYLDVRDVADAYRLLVEAGEPGEVYNVASGRAERIGDLLDILIDAAGLKDAVEIIADRSPRPGDPEVLVGDSSKLQKGLGWRPEIPLATSLVDTLDSYRARVLNVEGPNTRRT